MNWKATLRKYYKKAVLDKGTPEYIAKGWALGMFCGLAIPFGAQLMFSIPLSFLLKCSKIGATLGTLVTNHVTIFVIYPLQCWVGNKLIGGDLSFAHMQEVMRGVIESGELESLLKLGMQLVISFFLGGILFALIASPPTYFITKKLVILFRERREKRKQERARKNAEKIAGKE